MRVLTGCLVEFKRNKKKKDKTKEKNVVTVPKRADERDGRECETRERERARERERVREKEILQLFFHSQAIAIQAFFFAQ